MSCHTVYGAGIRTHDLSNMSHLPQPKTYQWVMLLYEFITMADTKFPELSHFLNNIYLFKPLSPMYMKTPVHFLHLNNYVCENGLWKTCILP